MATPTPTVKLKLTVVQCPSVSDASIKFTHEACSREACAFWAGSCTAATETEQAYAKLLDQYPDPGECPMALRCRWHLQAVEHGQTKCLVRRLGEICEHQGGEWVTFDMAPPEEWMDT